MLWGTMHLHDKPYHACSQRDLSMAQGYAVKAGMLVGRGERLLFMDADGATRVSDLEKLEAALASIMAAQGDCFL